MAFNNASESLGTYRHSCTTLSWHLGGPWEVDLWAKALRQHPMS